ncbi:MAG: hypothetical protein QOE70_4288 [Chthoniobacter sp.]|jgi:hypothetical protein|nr:hypothetical protein [Chthoniobacter sp.]
MNPSAEEIIAELRPLGRESYKRVILKHGIQEPCLGVKIEELKKIQKRIKKDQPALDLYDSGWPRFGGKGACRPAPRRLRPRQSEILRELRMTFL